MANYKHGFRKYSDKAKAAGEVMRNCLLLAKSDLTVQEARDACTFPSPTEWLEGDDDGSQ